MQYIKVSYSQQSSQWKAIQIIFLLQSEFIPRLKTDGARACHIKCLEHVMGVSRYHCENNFLVFHAVIYF